MQLFNNVMLVGITGNISSGKSTILELFKEYGCVTISTDAVAHRLLEENRIKEIIIDEFGKSVLDDSGKISRPKLANIVFNNREKLKELELILHPEIEEAVMRKIHGLNPGDILAIEIPLLFEAGWDTNVDHTVLITCPKEIRKERFLKDASHQPKEFEIRDALQWPEDKKSKLAGHIIDNSRSVDETASQVKDMLNAIKKSRLN